ncbi:MAG: hypothetical protein ACRBF0_19735 [Calditrichia bacterium]
MLFELTEFKKATKVERMYMHLLDPFRYQLRDSEDEYLKVLTEAYSIICEGRPTRESRRIVRERLEGRTSYRTTAIIKDCQDLYGRFEEVNQRVQAGIYRDKLQLLAKKAEQIAEIADNEADAISALKEARRCYESLISLDQADKIELNKDIDTTLPEIEFTESLSLSVGEHAEDAEIDTYEPHEENIS